MHNQDNKVKVPLRSMTLDEFSKYSGQSSSELILILLKKGVAVNKNQLLSVDQVEALTDLLDIEVYSDLEVNQDLDLTHNILLLKNRPPVIVVIGHVDHGKTSLLDYIRNTRVTSREKGGITQHLGAYEVDTAHGRLTFLDTPGHEAFSTMRLRGTKAADIAILIVAADDGVMPQTIEAIKHAKACDLPAVVAINKIDKATEKQISDVKNQIAQHGLIPEEWGGDVPLVPISAKNGTGIDDLLEIVAIKADELDLQADIDTTARGYVLESKLGKGVGPVATFISQHGTIKLGDTFLCGSTTGKVNVLVNSLGVNIKSAGPSVPVRISGFDSMPEVGDALVVVSNDEYNSKRSQRKTKKSEMSVIGSLDDESVRFILKADVQSSKEAIIDSMQKVSQKVGIPIAIISSGIGSPTENDIELASISNSIVLSFTVKPDSKSSSLAKQRGVDVLSFDIIYKLLEYVEDLLQSKIIKKDIRTKIGEVVIRKVFNIKGVGIIAGFYVRKGKIVKDCLGEVYQDNKPVFEGKIKSLQKDKKTVKELVMGSEGAFHIDGFTDWKEDDIVICYDVKKA